MRTCHSCGTPVVTQGPVGFRADCPSCSRPLHVCLNCRHHDAWAGCREPAAERVRDVDRANFCDWFQFVEGERGDAGADTAARDAAEKLFRKG